MMRWFIVLLTAVFVVTLTTVVGARSSLEWGPFLFGILCGGIASIPASVVAFYLAKRTRPQPPTDDAAYAPLVIVNTPSAPQRAQLPDLLPLMHSGAATQVPPYRVVGGD